MRQLQVKFDWQILCQSQKQFGDLAQCLATEIIFSCIITSTFLLYDLVIMGGHTEVDEYGVLFVIHSGINIREPYFTKLMSLLNDRARSNS